MIREILQGASLNFFGCVRWSIQVSTLTHDNHRDQPEGAAELLIVHGGLVLALTPFLGHELGLVELELALLAHPGDTVPGVLVRQQLKQKLPKLDLTIVTWGRGSKRPL